MCVAGSAWWDSCAWLVGGHFLRVLSWGMHGIVGFPPGKRIQSSPGPAGSIILPWGWLDLGQVWGHWVVTPRGRCCTGTWGTGDAVTSSPSPFSKEQMKISVFQGWFHMSLGWHRAGAACQDRGWQLCPWQVLAGAVSPPQQCLPVTHSSQPAPEGRTLQIQGATQQNQTSEQGLLFGVFLEGNPPLGFTTAPCGLPGIFGPPSRCRGYIHVLEKCKVDHPYPGQQHNPEFSFEYSTYNSFLSNHCFVDGRAERNH